MKNKIQLCEENLAIRNESSKNITELVSLLAIEFMKYEAASDAITQHSKTFGSVLFNKIVLNLGPSPDFRSRLELELFRCGVYLSGDLARRAKPKDDLTLQDYVEMRNANVSKILKGIV